MNTHLFAGNKGISLRSMGVLLGLALMVALGSCTKDAAPCTNCNALSMLQVEGTVYDQSSNLPLSGQPVSVTLNQNPFCLPCSSYKLASGVSDNNGHFQLSYSMDTSLLKDHHINVSVPLPANYILFPVMKDSFSSKYAQSADTRYFGYDNMDSMQNLKFGFYEVTTLQVNLHRMSPIFAQTPYLFIYVNIDGSRVLSTLSITQTEANKDTSFVLNTSPNLFTKINWNKYTTPETVRSATDSIKCKPTGKNAIDIYY